MNGEWLCTRVARYFALWSCYFLSQASFAPQFVAIHVKVVGFVFVNVGNLVHSFWIRYSEFTRFKLRVEVADVTYVFFILKKDSLIFVHTSFKTAMCTWRFIWFLLSRLTYMDTVNVIYFYFKTISLRALLWTHHSIIFLRDKPFVILCGHDFIYA